VFTAQYRLISYVTQIRFIFKGLRLVQWRIKSRAAYVGISVLFLTVKQPLKPLSVSR